jgi:peptidyl-prolyl cis-trans isomerase D
MAKPTQTKLVTKKHLARQERERIQRRYILIGTIVTVLLVTALIIYGILDQTVMKPLKPVAKVNGDAISTREFVTMIRYQRAQVVNNYYQISQYFGENTYFWNQAYQQLQAGIIDVSALENLIEDRLIRQAAKKMGITVSSADIDKALQDVFAYYPAGTPTPKPTSTTAPTQVTPTLSPLQETLVAPIASATATTIPTSTPTTEPITPTATATATQIPLETATVTPTSEPTATATPYTLEAYKGLYSEYVSSYKQFANLSEKDLRRITESRLYREKVKAAILADTQAAPLEQEYVWARHILVSSEITATQIIARLNNGDNFATLAAEFSIDDSNKAQGGDLGWFASGKMEKPFETAAFALQNIGDITQTPVETTNGFHVIQLLGRENRPFTTDDERFQWWLDQQRSAATVKTYDYSYDILPTTPVLPAAPVEPTQEVIPTQVVTPQAAITPIPAETPSQ